MSIGHPRMETLSAPRRTGAGGGVMLTIQLLLVAVSFLAMVVPLDTGRMLFRPLRRMSDAQAIRWIMGHDARLIAKASGPGTFYIEGRPFALFAPALSDAVILLRSDVRGCGAPDQENGKP